MAKTRKEKEAVRLDLEKQLASSKSVVFASFNGVTVADVSGMRREMKAGGVSYRVVKKSIAEKALAGSKVSGAAPTLMGQIAFAFSDDLIAPAREVLVAGKKLDNKVKILGGIFDGVYKDAASMMEIALIPSIPTLRGMFVNIINSPIQRFVIALNEVAKKKTA